MTVLADHVPLDSLEWLRSHGVLIAVVLAVALVVSKLGKIWVRRVQRRLEGTESVTQELSLQRTATLTQTLSYAVRVAIWAVAVLLILDQGGLNLAPLLAGAGIAGVALGFGAQSLVRDFLSGFFILLENQFGVGDVVELNTPAGKVTGKVETLTLRVTAIRAFDGTLHVVPNGNILVTGNRFRGWARAIVDIQVAYGEDVDRVRGILEELFEEMRRDPDLQGAFTDGPRVLGVETLSDYAMVVRVVAETRPSKRWDTERELRGRMKSRFDERGIQLPVAARLVTPRGGDGGDGDT